VDHLVEIITLANRIDVRVGVQMAKSWCINGAMPAASSRLRVMLATKY
jgi:hypothetical protein